MSHNSANDRQEGGLGFGLGLGSDYSACLSPRTIDSIDGETDRYHRYVKTRRDGREKSKKASGRLRRKYWRQRHRDKTRARGMEGCTIRFRRVLSAESIGDRISCKERGIFCEIAGL
eukprot:1392986-Amorphochlora_amoeboformis.AAC.2